MKNDFTYYKFFKFTGRKEIFGGVGMTNKLERKGYEFVEVPQHVLSEDERRNSISRGDKTLYILSENKDIRDVRIYLEENKKLYRMLEPSIGKFFGVLD